MEITNIAVVIWIVAVINIILGIFVYKFSGTRVSKAFLIATLSHAVWQTIIGIFICVRTVEGATLFVKLAYFSGALTASLFSFFFFIYPNDISKKENLKSSLTVFMIIFGYLVLATDFIIANANYIGGISYWGWSFGSLWYLFPLLFFGTFLSGMFFLLYKGLHTNDPRIKRSSIIIFFGVNILVVVPAVVNIVLPQIGIFEYLWLGPILNTFWIVFIAYAIFKYEALNIRLIATRAIVYASIVSGIGLITVSANFFNTYIQSAYPTFPGWLMYLISAVIIAVLGYLVWLKLRENDVLKYEFITTATHKFRTPLTHIKWATENLELAQTPEERLVQIGYIREANAKLVELTNVLMNVSGPENQGYEYKSSRKDLSQLVRDTLTESNSHLSSKHLKTNLKIADNIFVNCDESRIRFVIQTLVDNAVNYTPNEGVISMVVSRSGVNAVCSIRDSGIGILHEELSLIFSKFYRGSKARITDTEGMGIGLFISKDIISRHGGKIWAESNGTDKGSTFSFSIPIAD